MGALTFDIDGNNKKLLAALDEAKQQIQRTIQIVESTGEKMDATLANAGKSVSDAMDKAGASAEKAADKIDQIGSSDAMGKLEKEADKAADAMDDAADAAEDMGNKTQDAGEKAKESADGIGLSFGKIGKAIGAYFAVSTLKDFAGEVINTRKEFESLQVSFSTMLGSDVAGSKMFKDITDFATQTPLLEKDLASAAQTMLGFGIDTEKVMPLLHEIGDISQGDSQKLQSLALAFSQASSTGKLMGQDLLQMINAGFNPLSEMARTTGKSMAELKDEMSKGQISVQMLEDAFKSATAEGGKFHDALLAQSQTIGGSLSNLEGAVQKLFNDIGEGVESPLASSVNGLTSIVNGIANNLGAVSSVVGALTATFGVYKTACLVATAATNAHGLAQAAAAAKTKLLTMAQAALNKTMLLNPYVAAATAIAALVAGLVAWRIHTNEQSVAEQTLQRVQEKASAQYDQEAAKIDVLKDKVHNSALSYKERKSAIEDLQKIIPDYHASLSKEGQLINDNADAITRYLNNLEQQITLQAAADELEDAYRKKRELRNKETAQKQKADAERKKDDEMQMATGGNAAATSILEQSKLDDIHKEQANNEKAIATLRKEIADGSKNTQNKPDNTNNTPTTTTTKTTKSTGKTAAQLASERLQAATDEEKAAQDAEKKRLRDESDFRAKLLKTQIDNMQDGSAKRLKEMQYEAKAERVQLKRDEEDAIAANIDAQKAAFDQKESNKAAQSSTYAKQVFTADNVDMSQIQAISDRYDKLRRMQDDTDEKRLKEFADAEAQAMRDYLKEYGTFQEQRAAIAEEWDEKIANAEPYQRKGMEEAKTKDLIAFDDKTLGDDAEKLRKQITDELMQQPIAIKAQLDMESMSDEDLKDLRTQLISGLDSLRDLPTDKLQELQQMLNGINDTLTERNPFSAFKEADAEVKSAADEVTQYATELITARKALTDARASGDKMKIAQAERDVATATNHLTNATNKQTNADKKAKKGKAQLGEELQGIGSDISQTADIIGQFSDKAGQFINGIGSMVSAVGNAMKVTSADTTASIKAIESASAVLAIISAAIQLATAAASLFTGDGGKADYQEAKSEYESLVEVWDELIARKKEYLSESWGDEIEQTGEELQALYKNEEEAAAFLAQKRLSVTNNGHSMNKRMWNGSYTDQNGQTWSDVAAEIDAAYGTNMQGEQMLALTKMSGEQLEEIKEKYYSLWAVMDGEFKESLENIISYGDAAADAAEDVQNQWSQTSFDEMYDNFTETLMDMSADADTFGDNLAETMMKSLLSNQVGAKMKAAIQKWYDDYTAALSKNGGKLSESEIEDFQKRYNEIVVQGLAERDQIAEATGYDETSSSEASGSINAAKSMTEDTANELVGRITAVQLAVEQSRATNQTTAAQIITGVTLLSTMATSAGASQALLDSILLQHVESNGYLSDIVRLNRSMYSEWGSRIANIETKLATL